MGLEYLKDSQGNHMIAFSGFTYMKEEQHNQSKKYTKWNCVEKHIRCQASLLTFCSKEKLPELVNEHNHPPCARTSKDHIASSESESKACSNPESVLSLNNQKEIVRTNSSENNVNFILKSCTHSECQKQPDTVNKTIKTFPTSFNKELNGMQISDKFSSIHIMLHPCQSSLMCNAFRNKSGKKSQASVMKLQTFHSCGGVGIEWIAHNVNLKTLFPALLTDEHNVDVILASEGQSIKCHKLMLTSSSAYFEKLLNETIVDYCFPIVAFTDWHFWQLKALVEYLYCGKVTINSKKLQDFFSFVETLQIKGLQSWRNQTCQMGQSNTHSGKQNFQRNLAIQNRSDSVMNTIPQQIDSNYSPVECQNRKRNLVEVDDNIKTEGVNTKFARFVLFCARRSDDVV